MIDPSLTPAAAPAPIFISYAHRDNESPDPAKRWLDRLTEHLKPLAAQGLVAVWSDQRIQIGDSWQQHITAALTNARVAILLVSPAFLASDYIRNNELPLLFRRARDEGVTILPVILRPCLFSTTTFNFPDPLHGPERFSLADLQAANSPGKALSELDEPAQDRTLLALSQRVQQIFQGDRSQPVPQVARLAPPIVHVDASNPNRQKLLKRVRNDWVDAILGPALHHGRLNLDLTAKPGATERTWDIVIRQTGEAPQPLPSTGHIVTVFDDFHEQLLILGAPGAGKTIALLELARALLDRAQADPALPIPVVFNLSTWAGFRGTFTAWLQDELNKRYSVPKAQARALIANDAVTPLLDGLDEVAEPSRDSCVAAINTHSMEHPALVVCSRLADYEALTTRLRVRGAVALQPLTRAQILACLDENPGSLSAVRTALAQDETLWALLDTPLMLNVAAVAYNDTSQPVPEPLGTLPERRDRLFGGYVEAMFHRTGRSSQTPIFSREQTLAWLGWLAATMKRQNQTVFYLGRIQPAWLSTKPQRAAYYALTGLFACLIVTALFSLDSVVSNEFTPGFRNQQFPLLSFAIHSVRYGSVIGVLVGGIILLGRPVAAAALGVLMGPVYWLAEKHFDPGGQTHSALYEVFFASVMFGLLFAMLGSIIGGVRQVQPVERVRWSWHSARNAITWRLLLGSGTLGIALGFLTAGIDAHLHLDEFATAAAYRPVAYVMNYLTQGMQGLITLLAAGILFVGVPSGFSMGDITTRVHPNQEIWRPLKPIAIGAGALLGLEAISAALLPQFEKYLLFVNLVAVSLGLRLGGLAFIQHYTLRLIVWRKRYAPRDCIAFYRHAAELTFLRRVGGGYLFMHRRLLDHFAAMDALASRGDPQDA